MSYQIPALALLAFSTLTASAAGQAELVFEYDAGAAGNPSVVPTPESQGWTFDGSPPVRSEGLSPDGSTGRNGLRIVDATSEAGSTGRYVRTVTSFQTAMANALGFRVDVDMRMTLTGVARSINFEYFDRSASPPQRYLVYFDIDALDVILGPIGGLPRRCEGAMDGEYHRFSILHLPGAALAELYYDGVLVGSFAPIDGAPNAPSGFVAFGAGSSSGRGVGHFTRVQFSTLRPNAGATYCSPASENSSGFAAVIQATGSRIAADNNLVLYARNLPANQFGFFINGTIAGFAGNPGGSQGDICVGGTIGRYVNQIVNSGPFGEMSITLDLSQTPSGGANVPILSGQTWFFQAWFRDNNPTPTSNFTNGTRVIFQ